MSASYNTTPEINKVAFFGPWVGEFGWEIMSWQSWCRKEAKKYEKSYICSFPGMGLLYKDFAEFIPHSGGIRELWGPTPRDIDFSKVSYTVPKDVDVQIKPIWALDSKGDFIRFGDDPNGEFSCLIHARGIKTYEQAFKNYPIELWEKVAQGLPTDTACIGTMDDLHIKGTVDLRGIPLEETANYLAGCSVVVGGSSGLMCLALLCGTSTVVWGPRTASGTSLEERFKWGWNPFHTRVEYITSDDWQPDPTQIIQLTEQVLTTCVKPVDVIAKELELKVDTAVETTASKTKSRDGLNVYDTGVVQAVEFDLDDVVTVTEQGLVGEELSTLYATADELAPKVLVEIGARAGTSSTILGAVAKKHKGMLYSIEPNPQAAWYKHMKEFEVDEFTKLIPGRSPQFDIPELPFEVVDYLLIDGNHNYDYVLADYRFWKKLVRLGGRMAFHDYFQFGGVREAVIDLVRDPSNGLELVTTVAGKRLSAPVGAKVGLVVFEKVL